MTVALSSNAIFKQQITLSGSLNHSTEHQSTHIQTLATSLQSVRFGSDRFRYDNRPVRFLQLNGQHIKYSGYINIVIFCQIRYILPKWCSQMCFASYLLLDLNSSIIFQNKYAPFFCWSYPGIGSKMYADHYCNHDPFFHSLSCPRCKKHSKKHIEFYAQKIQIVVCDGNLNAINRISVAGAL